MCVISFNLIPRVFFAFKMVGRAWNLLAKAVPKYSKNRGVVCRVTHDEMAR